MGMIPLQYYKDDLKDIWWIEDVGNSCNVYVLNEGKVLIDAGNYSGMVYDIAEEFEPDGIEKIILTHNHFDHTGGLIELLNYCNPEIIVHRDTLPFVDFRPITFMQAMSAAGREEKVIQVRGGEKIDAGEFELQIVATPGHAAGDISIYEPNLKLMFTGDMVFPGSYEHTNLAAADEHVGDPEKLVRSLRRLIKFDVTYLMPGHGDPVLESGGEHIKNSYLLTLIKGKELPQDKAYLEVAQALADFGKLDEAMDCYDYVLKIMPENLMAMLGKAMIFTEKEQFSEALELFDEILETAPTAQEALVGKGFALLGLGRMDEALAIEPFRAKVAGMRGM